MRLINLLGLLVLIGISRLIVGQELYDEPLEEELQGWQRQPIADGDKTTIRSLLAIEEFKHLDGLGCIEQALIVRFHNLHEIRNVSMWTEHHSNAYFVWSRRSNEDWMPLRNVNGDRRVFRAGRSSEWTKYSLLEPSQALIVSELLFLPLRSSLALKLSSLQLRFFGHIHNTQPCLCFGETGVDHVEYSLKRYGGITETRGRFTFYLKTRAYNGAVLASHGNQGDFILVLLRKAQLMVVVNFGGNQPRTLLSSVIVNDGSWHHVTFEYVSDQCTLFVDGVRVASTSPPLLGYRLDLDKHILFGGAPYRLPYLPHLVPENFTGCLDRLTFNNRDIRELTGNARKCRMPTNQPKDGSVLALMDGNAWIEKRGRPFEPAMTFFFSLDLTGRVRTVSERGHVWRTGNNTRLQSWSNNMTNFSLSLIDGILSCTVILDGGQFSLKSHRPVNDGLWHKFRLKLDNNLVELTVDDQPTVRLEGQFTLTAPPDEVYQVGGDGLVGCVEQMTINDREEDLSKWQRSADNFGLVTGQCPAWDRCHPNPCTNGGTCRNSALWNDFTCDCPFGYSGRQCSTVDLSHSCREFIEFENYPVQSLTTSILIDTDDVGPFPPLAVQCGTDGSTALRHDQPDPVEVYGFMDKGSSIIDYKYGEVDEEHWLTSLAISALTKYSETCRQEMSYKCYGGASLMRTDGWHGKDDGPSSWWMSWPATHVYAWADGEPDSMMCPCAVSGTCRGGGNCNCDRASQTGGEDVGNVTRKELLPVRRVLVGDTDFANKRAVVNVGPMVCTGDEWAKPVTFLDHNAFMEVNFELIESTDGDSFQLAGYMEFRTRECLFSLLSTTREDSGDGCEYLKLHVEGCHTAVLTICGGAGVTKVTANFSEPVDSDNWHSIKFVVTATSVSITLDNEKETRTSNQHFYSIPDVGILHSWKLGHGEHGSGFTGAMRSVFLNGHVIPLAKYVSAGQFTVGAVKRGLVNRCVTVDEFGLESDSGYCMGGGQCQEFYYTIMCDCSETPFTGARCHQDVSFDLTGALSFTHDNPIVSTDTTIVGPVEHLRIGFQTTSVRSALLRGYDHKTKSDILALLLTDAGSLRLLYMDNYTPYTVEEDGRNFADGYFHDVIIRVHSGNRSIIMEVDHFRIRKLEWRYPKEVRPILARLDWIVGDDGLTSLFSGCLSRLQIGRTFFPFKSLGAMLRASGNSSSTPYRKSICPAIQDNSPEMEWRGEPTWQQGAATDDYSTSSSWLDAPRVKIRPLRQPGDRSVIVGGIGATSACILVLLMCCLVRFCRTRPAGEYKTHEETLYLSGPVSIHDSSQQALVPEPSPMPVERREWFI